YGRVAGTLPTVTAPGNDPALASDLGRGQRAQSFHAGRAAAPTPPAAATAGAAESTLTRPVSSRGHQLGGITESATDPQRRDGADRAGAAADSLDTATDHPLGPGYRARRDISATLGKESGTALLCRAPSRRPMPH